MRGEQNKVRQVNSWGVTLHLHPTSSLNAVLLVQLLGQTPYTRTTHKYLLIDRGKWEHVHVGHSPMEGHSRDGGSKGEGSLVAMNTVGQHSNLGTDKVQAEARILWVAGQACIIYTHTVLYNTLYVTNVRRRIYSVCMCLEWNYTNSLYGTTVQISMYSRIKLIYTPSATSLMPF